jgi:hypothetical protein
MCLVLSGALGLLLLSGAASAQMLAEQNAAMGMADNLNSQQVGPNPAGYIGRAQDAAGQAQGGFGAPGGLAPPGVGAPGFPGQQQFGGAAQGVNRVVAKIAKIQVITGTRVFDPVTGELLDDAQEEQVPATDKNQYFDDGTHGDVEANDGKYTKIDERKDTLSQSNQRIKERLVQALLTAEGLNPLEFYGFSLMSTERTEEVSRGRAWSIVKDPKGGPGFVMAEVPIAEPQAVPKYRKWQAEKDQKVKEDWAKRFLQEYRVNKDSLTSDFYGMYVPQPPPLPAVDAPDASVWQPFSDPLAGKSAFGGTGGGLPGQEGVGASNGTGDAADMGQFRSGYR